MVPSLTLRPAALADLDAIMAIERTPGFERFVGRSSQAEHRAMMASSNYAYLIGEAADGGVAAFAILRDLEDAHGNLYLKKNRRRPAGRGRRPSVFRPRRRVGVHPNGRAPLLARLFRA